MDTPFSFVGIADAYIDILSDTGERTGLELKGNCSEFIPKTDSERKELVANGRSNFGQVLSSITIPKPMTATIKFNQMDQALFAAAFFGTNSALTQAEASVSNQAVTSIADKWVELGKYMISTVVVKNEAGAVTYEEGTDYEVNPRLGMVKALSTGTIAAGAALKVSYAHAAVSGTKMEAMTKSNVRIRVKLDGQNHADGRNFISEIYQMRLNPSNTFSFIGTEFAEATFEGVPEKAAANGKTMEHIWLS